MTAAELKSDFKLTTDTPWGVYCGDLEKIDRVITAPHYIPSFYHFSSLDTEKA